MALHRVRGAEDTVQHVTATDSAPLCWTAGGAAGAPVGDGVTNVNMCGVWPAAKAPGPAGVTPSTALLTERQQHKRGCNQHCCLPVHA